MRRLPFLVLTVLACLAAAPSVAAQAIVGASRACPPAARALLDRALRSALANDHRAAATGYRAVADWPEGGDFPERARALHAAATELEAARDYEDALALHRAVLARFPASDFARLSSRSVAALDPPGARGIDFRKRQDEAWDVLLPALALDDRGESARARPGLEEGLALLRPLLAVHRTHPRAVEVAIAMSDVLVRLERIDEAVLAAEDALVLARANGANPGAIVTAERQLEDAYRASRRRLVVRASPVVLAFGLVLALAVRPWTVLRRRQLAVLGALVAAQVALAALGGALARHVRLRLDPQSFVTEGVAAMLVLLPALTGTFVGFALVVRARTRLQASSGALAAFVCSLAMAALLLHRLGFLHYVPEL